MLDRRIIYTKCMYNCLYHVSSVGKAVSLLEVSRLVVIRLFQLTRHDTNSCTYTMCIYCVYINVSYKKQELLALCEHLTSPPVFGGVRVALHFSFLLSYYMSLRSEFRVVLSATIST
jgi:hypothetical protein